MKQIEKKTLRFIVFLIIALLVFFILEETLISFFTNSIFDSIGKTIQSTTTNDALITILFLWLTVVFLKKISRKFRFSRLVYFLVFFTSIIYSYYRFKISSPIFFSEYSTIHQIKYLDWILIWFVIYTYSFISVSLVRKRIIENSSILFIDEPIQNSSEDLLLRKQLVDNLSGQLNLLNVNKSYALGITGKWGDGKTSLMNMIKEKVKDFPDTIIIEFNPWLSSNTNNIIEDYFLTFQYGIKEYTSELGYTIDDYASKFKISDSKNIIDTFQELSNSKTPSEHKYKLIKNVLIALDKKIFVFIDDIDRLDKKEVIEVIKLIRNSGSFHNTIFIVAYDRDYINEAVKGITSYNYEEYIDKVFQVEVPLPPIRYDFIKEFIEKKLIERFPKHKAEIIDALNLLENLQSQMVLPFLPQAVKLPSSTNYLQVYIRNYRDTVRLVNSVCVFYNNIQGEISLSELIILHLIKLKFKNVYDSLNNLSIIDRRDVKGKTIMVIQTEKLKELFLNNDLENLQNVTGLLQILFSETKTFPRSIIFPGSYELYFDNQIYGTISLIELSTYLNGDYDSLDKKVANWLNDNLGEELIKILRGTNSFNSSKHFENYVKILFKIVNESDNLIYDRAIEILEIKYYSKILEVFYEDKKRDELVKLVQDLVVSLTNSRNGNEFIHQLHQNFNYLKDYGFIFKYEQFKNCCFSRLANYLNTIPFIKETSFRYLYTCIDSIDSMDSNIKLSSQAIKIFRDKINVNPNEYLKYIIVEGFLPHDGHTYTFEGFTFQIFKDYEEFLKFLDGSSAEDEIVKTIRKFFELFKSNQYKSVYIKDEELIREIKKMRDK